MGHRELDWADRFFSRWGYAAVLVARMLPVIRTFIALPAGIARMPRVKFHIYTFLGSWPWCFILAWAGMKLGANWRSLGKYFHQLDAVIGVLLVAGMGGSLVALEESDGRHRTITFTLRILPIATLPIATSHRVSATRPGTHSALRISCHLLRLHLTLIRSPPPCRQTRELPGQLKQLRDSESRPS